MDNKHKKATCKNTGKKSRNIIVCSCTKTMDSEDQELYQFMVGGLQAK